MKSTNTSSPTVSFAEAQTIITPSSSNNQDFFTGLFDQFDDIKKGDKVRIVGKDKYKGHIGIVERTFTTQHNELVFAIELQSNGELIDRTKSNIKRCYI